MPEVVVVGGGPAGAATAIHLARRGREVVLYDREWPSGRKACGEGLFPRGVRQLRDLGVLEDLRPFAEIRGLCFQGYGATAEARLGSSGTPAIGVERGLLDKALRRRAVAEGVTLRQTNVAVTLTRTPHGGFAPLVEGGAVEAGVVVAADGLGSRLRRQAGLAGAVRGKRYGLSGHFELPEPPDARVQVFFRPGFEVYVTPVGECRVNVAVLAPRMLLAGAGGQPSVWLEELVRSEGCLPGGWCLTDAPLAAGPFPVRARSLWRANLVLTGDAAGFFDGITGEGMSLALESARDCAEAVDRFLDERDERALAAYQRRRRDLARSSELLGRLTLFLAGRPWAARRAISRLGRRPDAFGRLVAASTGEGSLKDVGLRGLLALLLG